MSLLTLYKIKGGLCKTVFLSKFFPKVFGRFQNPRVLHIRYGFEITQALTLTKIPGFAKPSKRYIRILARASYSIKILFYVFFGTFNKIKAMTRNFGLKIIRGIPKSFLPQLLAMHYLLKFRTPLLKKKWGYI